LILLEAGTSAAEVDEKLEVWVRKSCSLDGKSRIVDADTPDTVPAKQIG
jgi:hypothetical protein